MFFEDDAGAVFHGYSTYGRGAEVMIGAYDLIDLTPRGRDEHKPGYAMDWVHHDRYQPARLAKPATAVCSCCDTAASAAWA